MSNRRRRRGLGPIEAARIRRSARCPSCDSDVHVDRATLTVSVAHDEGCQTLAALEDRGEAAALLVRADGQTEPEWLAAIAESTRERMNRPGPAA